VKAEKLDEMVRGWFVGKFAPTAYATDACEVAVRYYRAAEKESLHKHLIATEITLVLYGRLRMVDREWGKGDIVVLAPGEVTGFEAITDCATVIVKVPGALNDKHLVETHR
jgi:quercetin dioxygenase-like cupin family protein